MTEFLIRHFVKDYENNKDVQVRQHYGVLSGVVGMACNAFLFVLKLLIGLVLGSISIMADAFNNLSDGLSSFISVVAFKLSGRAPDKKHPFGYGRTEYIAGFVVAALILAVGFEFLKSSFDRILHPQPVTFSAVLVAILAISMLVKLWMGAFNRTVGRRIQSTVLLAAMQDSINDVITTAVVIVGMIASQFTAFPVDGVVGVLVALFILWAGVGIAKDTLSPLIGQAADPEIAQEIKRIVLSCNRDIIGVHDLIIHNYGAGRSLASLHAEVPATANIVSIHEVIDDAEKLVMQETGVYLVIHMDPISTDDKRTEEVREITLAVLRGIDKRLTMHDFRIVDGKRHVNVIFDVVVPFEYSDDDKERLLGQIRAGLQKTDKRYHPVVVLDHQM